MGSPGMECPLRQTRQEMLNSFDFSGDFNLLRPLLSSPYHEQALYLFAGTKVSHRRVKAAQFLRLRCAFLPGSQQRPEERVPDVRLKGFPAIGAFGCELSPAGDDCLASGVLRLGAKVSDSRAVDCRSICGVVVLAIGAIRTFGGAAAFSQSPRSPSQKYKPLRIMN